jgi:hypothetical protein
MTHFENQLWDNILGFEFDEPGTQLTFGARLARENGWTGYYTNRVVAEYKKFIFLCCTSPHDITPSDPVDQAWHLHLTYTKSYWQSLCRDTLGKEIHHNPTKGGKSEQQKFSSLYKGLHEIYAEKFGLQPPPDIWHDAKTRFTDTNFMRVNLSQYYRLRKPSARIKTLLFQLLIVAIGMLCIKASDDSYGFLIVFTVFLIISAFSKKGGGKGGSSDGGCSSFSCSSNGHSGCSSHGGDSGCSSGCSGCGGGCGGGD